MDFSSLTHEQSGSSLNVSQAQRKDCGREAVCLCLCLCTLPSVSLCLSVCLFSCGTDAPPAVTCRHPAGLNPCERSTDKENSRCVQRFPTLQRMHISLCCAYLALLSLSVSASPSVSFFLSIFVLPTQPMRCACAAGVVSSAGGARERPVRPLMVMVVSFLLVPLFLLLFCFVPHFASFCPSPLEIQLLLSCCSPMISKSYRPHEMWAGGGVEKNRTPSVMCVSVFSSPLPLWLPEVENKRTPRATVHRARRRRRCVCVGGGGGCTNSTGTSTGQDGRGGSRS